MNEEMHKMMDNAMPYLEHLAQQIQNTTNIWQTLEPLGNALGSKTAQHLETLIIKQTPYSLLDIELLKKLTKITDKQDQNRLQNIIELMQENL